MKKIFIFASMAILFASCTSLKEMLDRSPLSKMSDDKFFSTESGLVSYSNTFYTNFPGSGSLYIEDADNYFQKVQLLEARGARTVPASASDGGWTWTKLRDINTLLDNIGQCPDESLRKEYSALAHFFRAYFYFEKVKRFGDVPWIETQLGSDSPQLYAPRDNRETVMQNMLKDIDDAIEYLPYAKSVYRVTKWTALALKARFCLFEGTFRKYHNITGFEHDAAWYLNEAAAAAKQFIDQSGYSIYTTGNSDGDYLALFSTLKYDADPTACEVILARNYNIEYSVYHNSNYTFTTKSMGCYGMTRKTAASYLMKDGSRFTDKKGWETMTFLEEMVDRDPRLAQSIRTPGYTRIGEMALTAPDLSSCMTGYQPIKYVTTVDKDTYNSSDNDLIIFRTAEVYLNYAEALAELENLGKYTVTQNDLDISVNMLRRRAGVADLKLEGLSVDTFLTNVSWGGYTNVTGTDASKALILEIRRERNVELNQEGFRYYDLMRWKEGRIFEQQMYGMYFPHLGEFDLDGDSNPDILLYKGAKPSSTAPVQLEVDVDIILSEGEKGMVNPFKNSPGHFNETNDKDYYYPIPTDELNLNKKLTQNPGW